MENINKKYVGLGLVGGLIFAALLYVGISTAHLHGTFGGSQEGIEGVAAASSSGGVIRGMVVTNGLVQQVFPGPVQSGDMVPAGMPAGTYGDAFHIPVTTYDISGRMTGFVNTPMQVRDAGGQVFNVKAYGAVGDGVTDDTVAIQNCINACVANANGNGGEIFFPTPSPYYLITAPLNVGNPSATKSSSIRMYTPPSAYVHSTIILYNGPSNSSVMQVIGLQDSRFENIGVQLATNIHNCVIWDQQFANPNLVNASYNRWSHCVSYFGALPGGNNFNCIFLRLGQSTNAGGSNGFGIVLEHCFTADYNVIPSTSTPYPSGCIGVQVGGSQNYSTSFYDCSFPNYCGYLFGPIASALTVAVNPGDPTVTVADIGLFPPSGTLSIGGTKCQYTAKTATNVTSPVTLYGPGTLTLAAGGWPGGAFSSGSTVSQYVDGPGILANNGVYVGNTSAKITGGSMGGNLPGYDLLVLSPGYVEASNFQGQLTVGTPVARRFIQVGVGASSIPAHVTARQFALKGYMAPADGNGVIWSHYNSTVHLKDFSITTNSAPNPYSSSNWLISNQSGGANGNIRLTDGDVYATMPFINNQQNSSVFLQNVQLTDSNGRAQTKPLTTDITGPTVLTDAATVTIDASLGRNFYLAMTSAIGATRALNISNAPIGTQPINLWLAQPASGGPCSITTPWFGGQGYTLKWLEGVTPSQSTTASAIDQYQISQPVANTFVLKQILANSANVPANIAVTNAQNTFTAQQQFNGALGLGVAPQPASNMLVAQPATQTLTSSNFSGITSNVTENPASTSTADIRGLNTQAVWQGTVTNPSGQLSGIYSVANSQVSGTGTLGTVNGFRSQVSHQNTGVTTTANGFNSTVANSGGGTITNQKGLYIQNSGSNASTTTNGYGIHVDSPSLSGGATMPTNYGIRIANQGTSGVNITSALRIDAQSGASGQNKAIEVLGGDVILAGSTLATTATNGFLNIPTCAGTPTGVPTNFTGTVPMVFDTTAGKLWIYFGGSWKSSLFQ